MKYIFKYIMLMYVLIPQLITVLSIDPTEINDFLSISVLPFVDHNQFFWIRLYLRSRIECEVKSYYSLSAKLRRQINKSGEEIAWKKLLAHRRKKTMVQLFYYENRGKCCRKLWKHDGNKLKVSKLCIK